jgi:hypothetical protein
MTNTEIRILGVLVTQRENESENVQRILGKYGCSIKTRLGLHEEIEGACNSCGLIILELTGETSEMDKLEKELNSLESLQVNRMIFPG